MCMEYAQRWIQESMWKIDCEAADFTNKITEIHVYINCGMTKWQ